MTLENPGVMFIVNAVLRLPAIVIVLTFHGLIKSALSAKLGNPVPGREGRLTLNPLRHMDPLGFLVYCFSGFGWDKPVNTNSVYYKRGKRDVIVCNSVPALCCLVLGLLSAAAAYILLDPSGMPGLVSGFFIHLFNVSSACFFINLIPIYPMDAAAILRSLLSPRFAVKYAAREKLLQFILLAFIWIGIADMLFGPCADFLLAVVWRLLGL